MTKTSNTQRTTFAIELDEETYTALFAEAARRGVSTDDLVHEAVDQLVRDLGLADRDWLTATRVDDKLVISVGPGVLARDEEPSN